MASEMDGEVLRHKREVLSLSCFAPGQSESLMFRLAFVVFCEDPTPCNVVLL